MISKDIEKKFVSQPIFKQLIDFIPKNKLKIFSKKHQRDGNYESFSAWTQIATMLFGVFSRCDSMGEICDGISVMQGILNHLGLDNFPAKSTAGDVCGKEIMNFLKNFNFYCSNSFNYFVNQPN